MCYWPRYFCSESGRSIVGAFQFKKQRLCAARSTNISPLGGVVMTGGQTRKLYLTVDFCGVDGGRAKYSEVKVIAT